MAQQDHKRFKGLKEEHSPGFSWEAAMLTINKLLLACSQPHQLTTKPHSDLASGLATSPLGPQKTQKLSPGLGG